MKFFLKPKLALLLLAVAAAHSAQAQDTLKVTLQEAVRIALSENPTIKVAGQEIKLKKEARREAYSGLFPEANLVGSYSRAIKKQSFAMEGKVIEVGTDNTYSGGLSVSLPVFAPALYKSISLTKTDVDLAVEKARSSRLDMVNQVTKAFYQLLLAQDSYEVLLKSYKQSEDNYNVVKAKYEQGSVSEYDKISAEVQMRSLKPTVVSARNGVNLATLQLKVLMGMEAEVNVAVDGNLKDYEMSMFTRQAMPRPNNLINNSTLKQLELNALQLKQNLKLQYTNFMPTLSANFQYMYTSINTERQLTMQATSYLDNMAASSEQVVSNKEAVFQAEKGRTIAEKRYEVGKGTILELNSSEVALTEAKLTYNQSIYDYLVAKADLDLVMGEEVVME